MVSSKHRAWRKTSDVMYVLDQYVLLCRLTKESSAPFAELFAVYAPSLVTLPDSISDDEAPLACGGLTRVRRRQEVAEVQVGPGRPVAVIGAAGGLGHYAVQLATAFGYDVVGVDVGAERLDFVKSLGERLAIEASDALDVIRHEFGGVDASLVFAARLSGFDLGFKALRPSGVVVAVGLPPTSEGNFSINPWELVGKDTVITSSAVGTVQDIRDLTRWHPRGGAEPHRRRAKLSELESVFDDLQAGRYVGRAVLTDLAN